MEAQARPLKKILTNSNTYPYNLVNEYHGLSIINNGADLTITLSSGLTFTVPASSTFDDYFDGFKTITASGSTSFQIGVR
jgi:hypothetical protein